MLTGTALPSWTTRLNDDQLRGLCGGCEYEFRHMAHMAQGSDNGRVALCRTTERVLPVGITPTSPMVLLSPGCEMQSMQAHAP